MSSTIFSVSKLILVGAGLFALGGTVWTVARAPLLVQLADIQRDHTRQQLRVAEDSINRLQSAHARGDELTHVLLQREGQIRQLSREKRDAIANATTGHPCLGEPALRLLNDAPGLRVAGVPQATGSALAAGSTSAANSVVTDTDIAGWAIDAGAQYESCRSRLDALIDWHTPHEH